MEAELENDPSNLACPWLGFPMEAEAVFSGDGCVLTAGGSMQVDVFGEAGIGMLTALHLGEVTAADPNRPSLILRRSGDNDLWEIAKECGSTVEAICKANGLTGEPEENKMLLIPIV
jgi:hypothetical protein